MFQFRVGLHLSPGWVGGGGGGGGGGGRGERERGEKGSRREVGYLISHL